MRPAFGPRPAIATFFGIVSLVWSVTTLGSVLVMLLVISVIGAGSWLGGPVLGFFGTALSLVVGVYLIASSLLSFVLLWAGWLTLLGDPRGVPLLRFWAWISLGFDTLSLLMTGGLSPGWFGLIYAIAVLYYTTPREIEMRGASGPHPNQYQAKPKFFVDRDF